MLGQVPHRVGNHLLSAQIYSAPDVAVLADMHTPFEQWAAAEVSEDGELPPGLETLHLPGGLYAVFIHRGTTADFYSTAQFIYGYWLPQSGYTLDQRPHFEVMGDKYRHNHPESEEEVYVPITPL
jgi:AraC family transcriptional regulator